MQLKTLIYEHKCKNGMTAIIHFKSNSDLSFSFVRCNYKPSSAEYTEKDWEDLGELSGEISKLIETISLKATSEKKVGDIFKISVAFLAKRL